MPAINGHSPIAQMRSLSLCTVPQAPATPFCSYQVALERLTYSGINKDNGRTYWPPVLALLDAAWTMGVREGLGLGVLGVDVDVCVGSGAGVEGFCVGTGECVGFGA